mmetsp:Transcript_80667/g.237054  ORF Transcript_80667/g.237054 Transcript_80667/m.237054 type:complete len:475 (-) Transcript_80667:116-1540(-)
MVGGLRSIPLAALVAAVAAAAAAAPPPLLPVEEDSSCLLHKLSLHGASLLPHSNGSPAQMGSSRRVTGTLPVVEQDHNGSAAGDLDSSEEAPSPSVALPGNGSLLAASSEANQSAAGAAALGEQRAHTAAGPAAVSGLRELPAMRSAWQAGLRLLQAAADHWDGGASEAALSTGLAVLCALVSLTICLAAAGAAMREPSGSTTLLVQRQVGAPLRSRQLLPTRPAASVQTLQSLPASRVALPASRTSVLEPPSTMLSMPLPASSASVQAPAPAKRQVPPALCPPLVLHDRETRLAIPMDALELAEAGRGSLEFDVLGPLSTPVFRAALQEGPGGRRLSLFVPRLQESQPWAAVRPLREEHQDMIHTMLPEGSTSCGKILEMVGQDGAFYGLIVAQQSSFWAIHRSLAVLVVEGEQRHKRLRATAAGGRLVASVAPLEKRSPAGKGVAQLLDLQVQAGVDPLLVLTCMLTIILLF